MSLTNLARVSYLGMGLFALSLILSCFLSAGALTIGIGIVGCAGLGAIPSTQWRAGLRVLTVIMLATCAVAFGFAALGSFSLLSVAALQVLAIACLDNRATANCATDLQLARLRP